MGARAGMEAEGSNLVCVMNSDDAWHSSGVNGKSECEKGGSQNAKKV